MPVRVFPSIPMRCPWCREGGAVEQGDEAQTPRGPKHGGRVDLTRPAVQPRYRIGLGGRVTIEYDCGASLELDPGERGWRAEDGGCPRADALANDLLADRERKLREAAVKYRLLAARSRKTHARLNGSRGGRPTRRAEEPETQHDTQSCGFDEIAAARRKRRNLLPEIAAEFGVPTRALREAVYGA